MFSPGPQNRAKEMTQIEGETTEESPRFFDRISKKQKKWALYFLFLFNQAVIYVIYHLCFSKGGKERKADDQAEEELAPIIQSSSKTGEQRRRIRIAWEWCSQVQLQQHSEIIHVMMYVC